MGDEIPAATAAYNLAKRDALATFHDEMSVIAERQRVVAARYASALLNAATARRAAAGDKRLADQYTNQQNGSK